MPGYSSKRNDGKRWNSGGRFVGQKTKRDDRRNLDQRRPMVSPWESGVTPGMGAGLLGNYSQNQASTSAFLLGAAMARGEYNAAQSFNNYGAANKIRRLDRMGGFDEHRGRGLLPSPPSAPLLGVAPSSFSPQSRGPENLQHRLGAPWGSSIQSGPNKGLSSGYYPSKGRQDSNSRRYAKPKRSRTSNSSRSGIRDAREKLKGSANKNSSSKDRELDSKESKSKESEGSASLSLESNNKESVPEVKKDEPEEPMETEEDASGEKCQKEHKSEEKADEAKQEKKKQEDPFPAEALYCHICDLDNFATKKGYIRHLEGMTHSNMAETFHAKNASTLELLNISAKFAQMRRRDKLIRKSGKKGLPLGKIIESSLVEKFLHPGSCCGEPFDSPYELEEHKLTIQHLLNMYEQKKEKNKEKPIDVDEEKTDSKIVEARKRSEETPVTPENIPAYDSSMPFGMEFIEKKPVYYCTICRGEPFKSTEMHCLSINHYNSIVHHFNKQEEKRLEEKIEAEKKLQAAKKEEEKRKQEEKEQQEKSKAQNEKEDRSVKADPAEDIDDELDVNYSDDEMKSSSPSKIIGKYLKEDEDLEEEVDPEEDPGEMIVLDEKEFENDDEGQEPEPEVEAAANVSVVEEPPAAPPVQEEEKRATRQRGRGRMTRSKKSSVEDFML